MSSKYESISGYVTAKTIVDFIEKHCNDLKNTRIYICDKAPLSRIDKIENDKGTIILSSENTKKD